MLKRGTGNRRPEGPDISLYNANEELLSPIQSLPPKYWIAPYDLEDSDVFPLPTPSFNDFKPDPYFVYIRTDLSNYCYRLVNMEGKLVPEEKCRFNPDTCRQLEFDRAVVESFRDYLTRLNPQYIPNRYSPTILEVIRICGNMVWENLKMFEVKGSLDSHSNYTRRMDGRS
ncbi:hypothetical protein BO70DRAFT_400240 [Aspergillus heteromorphus CBS 117.55]|uniref:Uncharacterized protein n=1 Tax=Aspergillus heteromorphus CBS 117.55 TaxID=1448321 RepID=A0A317V5P7_9EURO|nr:uncharacterized protein BO70DRAFT_400240 [Aspergillus heteromorphus CBS 117.55]PWY68611.1 hypothetical protein BO70DRAFT_400240 [Aspergillus heteromorphus CBS 117.55]